MGKCDLVVRGGSVGECGVVRRADRHGAAVADGIPTLRNAEATDALPTA